MSPFGPDGGQIVPEGSNSLDDDLVESHLSRIETHWTAVVRAHRGPSGDDAARARGALLERYGGAVRRYLLASLRDVDAADDLARNLRSDFCEATSRTRTRAEGDSATSSSERFTT